MEITKRPIKLKNGGEVPAGCPVTWRDGKATVHDGENRYRISAVGAAKALGIELPSDEDLGRWVYDSVCESVLGYMIEPDGIDEKGSPSWLLAMKLI